MASPNIDYLKNFVYKTKKRISKENIEEMHKKVLDRLKEKKDIEILKTCDSIETSLRLVCSVASLTGVPSKKCKEYTIDMGESNIIQIKNFYTSVRDCLDREMNFNYFISKYHNDASKFIELRKVNSIFEEKVIQFDKNFSTDYLNKLKEKVKKATGSDILTYAKLPDMDIEYYIMIKNINNYIGSKKKFTPSKVMQF